MPLSLETLSDVLADRAGPCVSLYMPTHRRHPDNAQDPIRFRNSVKSIADTLAAQYPEHDAAELLQHFEALAGNTGFWNHTLDGLAVLAAPGFFRIHTVQRPVPERMIVADSFHIKPLLRILQSADRYRVLALSRSSVRLFAGNRDRLDEVPLPPGVPRTPADVAGDDFDGERALRNYGRGRAGKVTQHGTDLKQDARDHDTELFFRAVDRAILEAPALREPTPMLLAALPENHHRFRRLSHNPALSSAALYVNADTLSAEDLQARAWKLVQPYYLERLAGLTEAWSAAHAHQRSSDDLSDIGRSAIGGRVDTLLVDADRVIPGALDAESGAVSFSEAAPEGTDDLLDDLAEAVLRAGGEVVIVPGDQMPTQSGAAAIYRY